MNENGMSMRSAHTAFVLPEYEKDIDHAGLIRGLDDMAFKRGEAIYTRVSPTATARRTNPVRFRLHPGSLPTRSRTVAIRTAFTARSRTATA